MALRNTLARLLLSVDRNSLPASFEEKASLTGPLIALHMNGQPVWTPRNYTDLAREGYARNAIVYRCVRMVSEAAASVPLLAFEDGRERDEHPLLKLLSRPNATQCAPDLFEAWYGSARTGNDD